jgi:pyruvate dehydrogenase E1 component beta subunit
VEVVDLRTIVPMDIKTILESAKKTGRVVIVHEAVKICGVGAEVSALISENAMDYMKAPILRVTGFDTPFPYTLEHVYMPDSTRVLMAMEKVMEY